MCIFKQFVCFCLQFILSFFKNMIYQCFFSANTANEQVKAEKLLFKDLINFVFYYAMKKQNTAWRESI